MGNTINRLICVSSINQIIVALACLRYNERENETYNDYLIVNNAGTNDSAFNMIMKICKACHNFIKIIDFRNELAGFKKSREQESSIRKIVSSPRSISGLRSELFKQVEPASISEIYLRYKLNLPEHLILKTFSDAEIFLFEDGLHEYVKQGYNKRGLKYYMVKCMYRFKEDNFLRNFFLRYKYEERISNRFSVIYDDEIYTNIKKHYKYVLEEVSLRNGLRNLTNKDCILLILHRYSEFTGGIIQRNISISDELKYYEKLLRKISIVYPEKEIIVKAHPNTSQKLFREYSKLFGSSLIERIQDVPSEVLIALPEIKIVIGALSSSLLYAKECFGKEVFFLFPSFLENVKIWEASEEALLRYGIFEMKEEE